MNYLTDIQCRDCGAMVPADAQCPCGSTVEMDSPFDPEPTVELERHEFTGPSHWAAYLINADDSGLGEADLVRADDWLLSLDMGTPVGCTDAGFKWTHDASDYEPAACDCQTYTFLKVKE